MKKYIVLFFALCLLAACAKDDRVASIASDNETVPNLTTSSSDLNSSSSVEPTVIITTETKPQATTENPATESPEPTAPPTEPTTAEPTQPSIPPTQPTVLPTEPTIPPTQPIEPTVLPTQPQTQPTEPPTTPTVPTTEPTIPEPTTPEPTQPPTEPTTPEPTTEPITEPRINLATPAESEYERLESIAIANGWTVAETKVILQDDYRYGKYGRFEITDKDGADHSLSFVVKALNPEGDKINVFIFQRMGPDDEEYYFDSYNIKIPFDSMVWCFELFGTT